MSESFGSQPVAPTFTVVIPTHQSSDFVVAAIRSVLAQTDPDFEIIVIDNGSTDGTDTAVAAIGDPRIEYRWQEDSGLPAESRNKGVEIATGEWVCFLDADDTWVPSKLARVAEAIAADPSVSMVCHDVRQVDLMGREIKRRAYTLDGRSLAEQLLYRGDFLTTSATCVRRDVLAAVQGFDVRSDYFTVEDYDLWLRLAENGARLAMISEPLGDLLVHPGGASRDLVRNYDALMRVFDDHASRAAAAGSLDIAAMVRRRARARLAEVRDLLRGRRFRDAVRVGGGLVGELLLAAKHYRLARAIGSGADRG
ncbi:MAG TPA: glycosyltransferase [Coriobacteriia bacterium]